jgi:ribosomal protein S27AE
MRPPRAALIVVDLLLVISLVIIGLVNFSLLISITGRVIAMVAIIGAICVLAGGIPIYKGDKEKGVKMKNAKKCPKCGGSGRILDPDMPRITGAKKKCPVCEGTGYVEG